MASIEHRNKAFSPVHNPKVARYFNWEAIYGIWMRDIKKFARERSRLLGGVARPILWLLILGGSLRSAVDVEAISPGVDYQQYIFPGVIGLTLVFSSMQSAISIIWDREFGFLKEVLAAPVPRLSIIIGKALGGASQATMQGVITMLFAPLIGLWLNPLEIVALIVMMFGVAFSLTALGIVIASNMSSFEGFGVISNFIVMPMYFLSGAIYPSRTVPDWLKPLIVINPLSYGVDALRHITIGVGTYAFWADVAFLAVFAVVMLGIALPIFNREQ